jgi:hypothetical protein
VVTALVAMSIERMRWLPARAPPTHMSPPPGHPATVYTVRPNIHGHPGMQQTGSLLCLLNAIGVDCGSLRGKWLRNPRGGRGGGGKHRSRRQAAGPPCRCPGRRSPPARRPRPSGPPPCRDARLMTHKYYYAFEDSWT